MSTFADSLPQAIQSWGLGIGILLATIGSIGAIWHFVRTWTVKPKDGESTNEEILAASVAGNSRKSGRTLGDASSVSPLKIVFDPANPGRRFWSIDSMPNPNDPQGKPIVYWEHRVEIRNNSNKTARNVRVKVEGIGPMPMSPALCEFNISKTQSIDIHPKCSEFVWINRWPQPKIIQGMLAGESAWLYGPRRITASADDMLPAIRDFEFNWETEQMFFDKRPEQCHAENT